MGVTLALPLLDSMIPARTLFAQTAAKGTPRIGFVYIPHGAVMDKWTPATVRTCAVAAGIIASSSGSASAAPIPLRNVRLGNAFLVMIMARSFSFGTARY